MCKVAVIGYGTVGSGTVELFMKNRESISKKVGKDCDIKYILDLRDFPGDKNEKLVVHDYDIIVNDPEVKIICETMGGVEPAFTFLYSILCLIIPNIGSLSFLAFCQNSYICKNSS